MDSEPRVLWCEADDPTHISNFRGDFYDQDYQSDDFPGFGGTITSEEKLQSESNTDSSLGGPLSESSDDEDDAAANESQWEPQQPAAEPLDDASADHDVSMDDAQAAPTASNSLKDIPIYIDRFPGHAGETI